MPHWTEPFDLAADTGVVWDFGVRVLWCDATRGQLRVGWTDPERDELEDVAIRHVSEPRTDDPFVRAAVPNPIRVRLALLPCPRPVVSRPMVPLTVPARSQAAVFVGVPLWLVLYAGQVKIAELPAVRLSDTWFGGPTDGVLCYATRTHLRTEAATIPRRPFRALCRVSIRNDTSTAVVVERLRIPASALGIYESGAGILWTSDLSYVAVDRLDTARVSISEGPPSTVPGAKLLAPPRERSLPLARVFNALWRSGL